MSRCFSYNEILTFELTYLIFVATVVSINDRWSGVPQSFIDGIAKASLFDFG